MKSQIISRVIVIIERRLSIISSIWSPRNISSHTTGSFINVSLLFRKQFSRFASRYSDIFPKIILERGHYLRNEWKLARTEERGDVPGWVLVVLMTTGLVTAIWTIAAPRLSTILRNSLDSMNSIR
jgi:hypothetical protein